MFLIIHRFYLEIPYNHPKKLDFNPQNDCKLCAMYMHSFKNLH